MTYEQMKNIDIRTVDHDTLVEASKVKIDMKLPKIERMTEAVRQLKNPYIFKSGRIAVKLAYADTTATIDDRMESLLRTC